MAAETLAFAQAFDAAFALRHQLFELLGREVPILMHTDSAALFDAITRYKRTTEARLMIDIHAVREAYRRKELHNVALIRSEYNIADAMTKVPGNAALLQCLRTHQVRHHVEQYVIEPN
jgi:hypothetical protein